MNKRLLLLGGAGLGVFLLTRNQGAGAPALVQVPQSQTSDGRQPWPIGKRVILPDGRSGIVVAG